jgi:Spy/CpxP family protein refolding chaperone
LLLRNETTEAEVLRQAELVESMRAELGKAHTLMLYRMNRILSPEQRVKFNDMNERRDRGRREPPPIRK